MCGRFTLTANPQVIRDMFDLASMPSVMTARYNIAPTQPVAVITNDEPSQLTFHRWGLVPSWAKDVSIGNKLINARSETAREKPSFRAAFKRRRCLIPADGFYEWTKGESGKIPHFIHLDGRPVFAFAGLWEVWHSPEGDELRTCTILTTAANDFMKPLHHRMPVIVPPADYAAWLEPDEQPAGVFQALMKQYDSAQMAEYEVSRAVNSSGKDAPELIEPAS
jgi:putative SOS response-associated peptidase YedK